MLDKPFFCFRGWKPKGQNVSARFGLINYNKGRAPLPVS
jgi:hypothetical protein